MDLTVAICTYRRSELLGRTLESIAVAKAPSSAWELIIVDNGVEESVERLVATYHDRLPIRYVAEPRLGCSNARNRAVESCQAPIILFTDDDAIVDPQWLTSMVNVVDEHPSYSFWGGRVRALWETEQPNWFDDRSCPMLRDVIVQYDAGADPRPWAVGDLPFFTCNLAMRVEAVRQVGGFDTRVGHVGETRVGNEDARIQAEILRQGGQGWYNPHAIVDHPVPIERLTQEYALEFARRQGRIAVDFLSHDQGGSAPRWLYRLAAEQWASGWVQSAKGFIHRDAGRRFAGRMARVFARAKIRQALQRRSQTQPNAVVAPQ